MDKNMTISETGSILMGAGVAKLDNVYIGVSLIVLGVLLKVMIALLNKQGIEVATSPEVG